MKTLLSFIILLLVWQTLPAATFDSFQTGNWSAAATWTLISGADADGIPDADDDVTILSGHTVTLNNAQACTNLTVQGILTASTGGNLAQSGSTTIAGTLNLSNGVLDFSQVFALTGTVSFNSGTYTFGAGGFSGTGTVTVASGTVTFNAGSSLGSNLSMSGGTLNDNAGLSPVNVTMTAGTYQGTGSPMFSGTFNWNGGTLRGSGTVTVNGSFTSSSGNPTMADSKELRIESTGTITSNSARTLAFGNGSAKLTVAPTGSLTFDGSSTLGSSGGAGTLFSIENGGNLVKTGSGTVTIVPLVSLAASSAISIDNGALVFNGASQTYNFTAGSVAITAPGSFTLDNSVVSTYNLSGISISGTGTLVASASAINVEAGTSITSKLTVANTSFNDNIGLMPGEVTLGSGGAYQGTGSPTFASGFLWSGGNLAGSGTVTVSGSMAVSTSSVFIQGTKELHLGGSGTTTSSIFVNSGTKFIIQNGGSLAANLSGGGATIGNGTTGVFEIKTGGSLTKTGASTLIVNCQFLLSGGALTISEGIVTLSTIGATHIYSGGTVAVNGTSELRHINSNTANFSNVAISGTGTFTPAVANFNAGSSLTCKLNQSGTLNDNVGLMPGEVTLSGIYQGTGSPTFANGFIWNSGGSLRGSGTVTMSGTMTGGSGSRSMFDTKILRITGTGTFTDSGIQVAGTSSLQIASGGSLTINNAGSVGISGIGSVGVEVQSGGSFTKTGAGMLTVSNTPFVNNGMLHVNTGAFVISNYPLINTGKIDGNGTVTINTAFTNSGTVAPGASPGILTFNKFSNVNSTLQVEIAGNGAAGNPDGFDNLVVTGTPADLGGTLDMQLLGGFAPASGQSFAIATLPNGYAGTFATITSGGVPPGFGWTVDYLPTSVLINFCPFWYFDGDGDSYGNTAISLLSCSPPANHVLLNNDCNDGNAAIHPGAAEICNGLDDDCNGNPESAGINWIGAGDALNWSNPLNWNEGYVPLPCQDVVIPAGNTVKVAASFNAFGKTLDVPQTAQLEVEATGTVIITN